MKDKVKELLAVLDLRREPQTPEEIQFQWSPLKVWVSKNLFDDPDECNAFFKGYISLADLAFRLRDEAVEYLGEWRKGVIDVASYSLGVDWENYWGYAEAAVWFVRFAKPIHWIIAALIAKELIKCK